MKFVSLTWMFLGIVIMIGLGKLVLAAILLGFGTTWMFMARLFDEPHKGKGNAAEILAEKIVCDDCGACIWIDSRIIGSYAEYIYCPLCRGMVAIYDAGKAGDVS